MFSLVQPNLVLAGLLLVASALSWPTTSLASDSSNYQPSKLIYTTLNELNNENGQQSTQDNLAGERVDKFASVSGDSSWPQQAALGGPNWFRTATMIASAGPKSRDDLILEIPVNQLLDNNQLSAQSNYNKDSSNKFVASTSRFDFPGFQYLTQNPETLWEPRNYRSLVNDFKHWSRITNPMRESRAFKPRLMSTARGFGKRNGQHVSYADLMAAAVASNSNGPMTNNGKMSGNAISAKYADWIDQVLSRWPYMKKFIYDKSTDYNAISAFNQTDELPRSLTSSSHRQTPTQPQLGDGSLSTDEKYQSL